VHRREFHQLGLAGLAAFVVATCGKGKRSKSEGAVDKAEVGKSEDVPLYESAYEKESIGPNMLEPGRTGSLCVEDFGQLWTLFVAMGLHWGIGSKDSLDAQRTRFAEIIALKTGSEPSFLAEYEMAAKIIGARGEKGLQSLFVHPTEMGQNLDTRFEHFRRYVVVEFAELHLTNGGFARFGLDGVFGAPRGPIPTAG
jgi:hypothetical protein